MKDTALENLVLPYLREETPKKMHSTMKIRLKITDPNSQRLTL